MADTTEEKDEMAESRRLTEKLLGNPDAMVWAQEFKKTAANLRVHPVDGTGDVPEPTEDEGWLMGWFANAMQTALMASGADDPLAREIVEMQRMADEDGRSLRELKEADEYRTHIISKVEEGTDGWGITCDDSTGLFAKRREDGPVPKVGSEIRIYGKGFGYQFHGIDIDGVELFWRTPYERVAERVKWLASHDRDKRERLDKSYPKLMEQYAALPDPMKKRIDRFVARDGRAFWLDGAYELFCCTEAAKFAERARIAEEEQNDKTAVAEFWALPVGTGHKPGHREEGTVFAIDPDAFVMTPAEGEEPPEPRSLSYAERWLLWAWSLNSATHDYDHGGQKFVLGADDGHSGNTFGGAMSLAWALLRGEEV